MEIKMEIAPKMGMDAMRADLPLGPALVDRAKVFAYGAHCGIGQMRKYDGQPYVNHLKSVARLVASVDGHTDVMLAAAWLHDTVEDTKVSSQLLLAMFGAEVTEFVWFLTDPPAEPEEGQPKKNRAERKADTRERLSRASGEIQTVKLADLIDNCISIELHDPDFWRVLKHETIDLLKVLRSGNAGLWNKVAELVGFEERRK